jgi:hypothetical protein
VKTWLLGTGWWTLWHIGLLALLLPAAGVVWWLSIIKPGGGPQGGELAAGLLLMFLLGWTVATFVHAMVFASPLPGGWTRFLQGALVWAVAWWAVGWGLYRLTNLAASNSAGLVARRAGLFGFIGLVLVLYAVNFTILARARGR